MAQYGAFWGTLVHSGALRFRGRKVENLPTKAIEAVGCRSNGGKSYILVLYSVRALLAQAAAVNVK
jgi:hypothetical protein